MMRHVQGLPEMLLPYLRLAHCTDSESLKQASLDSCCSAPISPENELTVLHQLASHLQTCLSRSPPSHAMHASSLRSCHCSALRFTVSAVSKGHFAPPGISAAIKSCTLSSCTRSSESPAQRRSVGV